MKIRLVVASALLVIIPLVSLSAESFVSLTAGPCWPRALLREDGRKTTGDASLAYGFIFDRKVGMGVGIDLFWNTRADRRKEPNGKLVDTLTRSSYMFPLYGFVVVDPLSHLFVHPALTAQVGYNSLAYSLSKEDSSGSLEPQGDAGGYYFGLFFRLLLDANYDFAEHAGLTAGAFYQWAESRQATTKTKYWPRDMSAFGLRAGFRFIF